MTRWLEAARGASLPASDAVTKGTKGDKKSTKGLLYPFVPFVTSFYSRAEPRFARSQDAPGGGRNPESASTDVLLRPDLDLFEERAAIIEFDGGESRETAERLAAADQGFASASAFFEAFGERETP